MFFDTTSLFFTGKARDEERFDGMWVLRTNTELTAVEIALRYKQS